MSEELLSPAPGMVQKLLVKKGDHVTKDTVVVILEAMKMENEIFASSTGTVEEIKVKEGDDVETDDLIMLISN